MTDTQFAKISLELNRHIVNLLDSLSAISELAALSIHDFDEPDLLKHALQALMSNQDMERCSIFLLGEDGLLTNAAGLDWDDMLRGLAHAEAVTSPPARNKTQCRIGEGLMGHAAETGVIEHCPSCADDPRFKKFGPDDTQVKGALICVPISCEKRVLGVLNVFHPQPGFFNLWHERLLLLFCQVLGRLLLNHRFTHHLGNLLDDRTREVMTVNAKLSEESALLQQAHEALERKHAFLRSIMDSMPEPIMVISKDYRLLMTNVAARKNAPQTNEGTTWTCHQISHHRETPCDGTEHQCPMQLVVASGAPASVVHEHFNVAGEPRLIELQASPLEDADGAIIGIVENARDITERRQAELALQEAKEYAENLIRTANAMVVELDAKGNVTILNPAAEAITGYSLADLAGRNWFEVLVPRDRYPQVWKEFERLMAGGIPKRFENPILTKSGEERYVVWQNSVLHKGGKVVGTVSFGVDITDRKQAELEYRTILETSTDGYLVADREGRVLDTNDAYCTMLGYSRNELLRMQTADLEAIKSPEEVRHHMEEISSRGHALFETRHRGKNGHIVDVEVSVTYLEIRGGMLIAFIRDITERKQTELQIRQLAYYDSLTNLPNRRLLLDRLDHALAQARRFQRSLAVMFLDLDRFKQINDTLGHNVGDELLKEVAKRLNACVRTGDTVSRQGGDEFVIVLAEIAHAENAALVAEKILASFEEPIELSAQTLKVTTSIGIAVYPVNNGADDIQALMKKADQAMYQSKEAGRNCYRFYQDAGY